MGLDLRPRQTVSKATSEPGATLKRFIVTNIGPSQRMSKRTGAVMVPGTPGGGGGSGEARRTSATTSWSSSGWPDDRASCAESTLP